MTSDMVQLLKITYRNHKNKSKLIPYFDVLEKTSPKKKTIKKHTPIKYSEHPDYEYNARKARWVKKRK